MPVKIPVTIYSLEDTRQEMERRSRHPYDIGAVQKAIREEKLKHVRVDGRTVVVTSEAIEQYLRKYGKYTRHKSKKRRR